MRTQRCAVMMACIQGGISDEFVETETTPATSSITRPAHLNSTRAQIAQGVEGAEHVDKDFVNHSQSRKPR